MLMWFLNVSLHFFFQGSFWHCLDLCKRKEMTAKRNHGVSVMMTPLNTAQVWTVLTYLCPSLPVEHRPSKTPRHRTLFWSALTIPDQLVHCCFSSASVSRLQLLRGRPLFLFPCGFQVRAWRVVLDAGFLRCICSSPTSSMVSAWPLVPVPLAPTDLHFGPSPAIGKCIQCVGSICQWHCRVVCSDAMHGYMSGCADCFSKDFAYMCWVEESAVLQQWWETQMNLENWSMQRVPIAACLVCGRVRSGTGWLSMLFIFAVICCSLERSNSCSSD